MSSLVIVFVKKRERASVSEGEYSEGSDDEVVVIKDIIPKENITAIA